MAENKIKFGLKNVYYAVATIAADGSATYDTPVAFPGAVSLSLSPNGDTTPFYADNIAYWVGVSNTGYEGDFEIAKVVDSFKTDVLGYKSDNKNVLLEDANAATVHFALLFQFEGDQKATRHVMYNCTATRPSAAGSTKTETVEPETETLTLTATSIYVAGLGNGMDIVKAESIDSTDSTTYSGWFSGVYIPTALA
jgi:phi13 family phage major tail protein